MDKETADHYFETSKLKEIVMQSKDIIYYCLVKPKPQVLFVNAALEHYFGSGSVQQCYEQPELIYHTLISVTLSRKNGAVILTMTSPSFNVGWMKMDENGGLKSWPRLFMRRVSSLQFMAFSETSMVGSSSRKIWSIGSRMTL
jgi:hypothetical protein